MKMMKYTKTGLFVMLFFGLLFATSSDGAEALKGKHVLLSNAVIAGLGDHTYADNGIRIVQEASLTALNSHSGWWLDNTSSSRWDTVLFVLWNMLGIVLFGAAIFTAIKELVV
jgi:hypothetical protein